LPPSCSFSREPVSSARNCRRSGLLENFGGSHFDYDRCSRRARAQPSLFAWRHVRSRAPRHHSSHSFEA
jgi:hypothetical protein